MRLTVVRSSATRALGGIAAMTGGGLWAVKSLAILTTGDQPRLLFEAAPALFGVAVGRWRSAATLATDADRRPFCLPERPRWPGW